MPLNGSIRVPRRDLKGFCKGVKGIKGLGFRVSYKPYTPYTLKLFVFFLGFLGLQFRDAVTCANPPPNCCMLSCEER